MKYLIFLILFVSCFANPEAFQKAEELPHIGVLQNTDGFIYLDIDDEFILSLIPFLKNEGFKKPPYFGEGLVGAHISVIYRREHNQADLLEIDECGDEISFSLKDISIVYPKRDDIDEVYLIEVEAPELDKIRAKYGLPKLKYPFHITIGMKYSAELQL